MTILVAYASKHGASREIAGRIAEKLRASGLEVVAHPMKGAGDLTDYDAFVIGSAVYFGSWMKEATEFVRRNQSVLAGRPVWLFSSGPLGTAKTDAEGHDLREAAVPKEIAGLTETLKPRDHRVFFGALGHTRLGLTEWLVRALPASRELFIEGDFRDWADVETWAARIAHELAPVPAGGR